MTHKNINYIFSIIDKEPIVNAEIIHNKNARKNRIKLSKAEYEETFMEWTLSKYIKKIEYDINNSEFFPMSSSRELSNGVSAESVLKAINSDLVFENLPEPNDRLSIRMDYLHPTINNKTRPYIGKFISFIYKTEWFIDEGFEHIDNIYETIQEGLLIIK